jgi:hypothetical protein
MLLNKIPCLDKGYVALIESMGATQTLLDLSKEFYFKNEVHPKLLKFGHMVLIMRCPVFVLSTLCQYGLDITHLPDRKLEAFTPHEGDIQSGSLETDKIIADDILRTTDALLINPAAYQADNCNRFVSQIIAPVSTYVTILTSANYNTWKSIVELTNLVDQVEAYRRAIEQIFKTEWK